MIPSQIIDPETNEPAEQQFELQPLHKLTYRADRKKACSNAARSSFSGGIDGRPSGA
jgi:hypothetical protein